MCVGCVTPPKWNNSGRPSWAKSRVQPGRRIQARPVDQLHVTAHPSIPGVGICRSGSGAVEMHRVRTGGAACGLHGQLCRQVCR